MELKVKGKDVELKFNIGFIRRLDELHNISLDVLGVDMQFGVGLVVANAQLQQYSPVMLSDIVQAAADCTRDQAEKAVEDYAEKNGSLDKLFEGVTDGLKKSPVVATTLKKLMA